MVVKFLLLIAITVISVSGLQAQETDTLRKTTINGTSIDTKGLIVPYPNLNPNPNLNDLDKIKPANLINFTVKQHEKVEADNNFAFKVFREVSKQESGNTFFSPLSLNMALGMLYNGSSADTRTEMVKVLRLENFSDFEINEYYQEMSQALLEIDPITELVIANSIWYRNHLPVKNTFIETGKKYFDAEVQMLNFNQSIAANMINKWCADKTKNKINHIVAHPLSDDMMMFLINAIYFKSKWQMEKKFDKAKTKLDDFTKNNNQKVKAYLMEQTTTLSYYADHQLQCVELPYGNKAFSMIAVLPNKKSNIDQLIGHLATIKWENIVNGMRQQMV